MNKVIAVFSPTGGIGVSTVAAHLAYQFANNFETAIVDMNPDFGSIGQILNFSPELPQNKFPVAMRTDSPFLSSLSHPKHSRLKFFPSPPSTVLDSVDWKNHLDNCKRIFPYTVVDLPHTFLVQDLFIGLEFADSILLVTEYHWASILSAKNFLESCHEGLSKKVKVVMNKHQWLPADIVDECQRNLGRTPDSSLSLIPELKGVHKIQLLNAFGKGIKTLADSMRQEQEKH